MISLTSTKLSKIDPEVKSKVDILTSPVKLSEHLYIVYSEFPHASNCNVYLVNCDTPFLIDCGSSEGSSYLLHNLSVLNIKPRFVMATHCHRDHTLGFHALKEQNPELKIHIHTLGIGPLIKGDFNLTTGSIYNKAFIPISQSDVRPLKDKDFIDIGNLRINVIHTPGHSPDSSCFQIEIDGIKYLFAGDTVFGGYAESAASNLTEWKKSISMLLSIEFDKILNGHNPTKDLPIQKTQLAKKYKYFGRMLNPWFELAEVD